MEYDECTIVCSAQLSYWNKIFIGRLASNSSESSLAKKLTKSIRVEQ